MKTTPISELLAAALIGLLALTGCTHLGPKTVAVDRFDYSTAIGDSLKQQTLLNIVKLRYMDLPIFVDVASIVAGYSMQTGASVNGTLSSGEAIQGNFASIGGSAIYTERPTITYVPMTGEKFLRGLITPIDPKNITNQMIQPIDERKNPTMKNTEKTTEQKRLEEAREQKVPWKKRGPYLSERQWGTVREDYSEGGNAWNFFTHDQARSRAYRWGEDGIAGLSQASAI